MPLPEITFELPASQYELMGYPGLQQGQSLDLTLDGGVLLPDLASVHWFTVQPAPLPAQLVAIERSLCAISGQIKAAEIRKESQEESATLLVDCGIAPVRVTCAPQEDGYLPFGTWETRYLAGLVQLQGIVEENFATPIGEIISVTLWGFHRLVLRPGDPLFGQCFTSDQLQPTPFGYDRVWITGRIHKRLL